LRWWSSHLGRLRREEPLRIVPVLARPSSSLVTAGSVLVEVGGARVRVTRGFDSVLLAEVVRALVGGR
jgi:hypothetical protein